MKFEDALLIGACGLVGFGIIWSMMGSRKKD
jgi:hypothetical protein